LSLAMFRPCSAMAFISWAFSEKEKGLKEILDF